MSFSNQMPLPLLGRIDQPSAAPSELVAIAKTYREAVQMAWQLRRSKGMTQSTLAELAVLYPSHVTDYLSATPKTPRELPAQRIRGFECAVGNTFVTQWLAAQAHLTVLEQLQADQQVRRVA